MEEGSPHSFSVSELLKKAESLFAECQFELAMKFYQRVLEIEPNNIQGLDGMGSLLLECGELDNAKEALIRSIRLAPESGAMKYLNLAQLLNGLDAIKCYHKGIELLIAHRAAVLVEGGQSELVEDLNQQIVSAYCATVEIYLTDSW